MPVLIQSFNASNSVPVNLDCTNHHPSRNLQEGCIPTSLCTAQPHSLAAAPVNKNSLPLPPLTHTHQVTQNAQQAGLHRCLATPGHPELQTSSGVHCVTECVPHARAHKPLMATARQLRLCMLPLATQFKLLPTHGSYSSPRHCCSHRHCCYKPVPRLLLLLLLQLAANRSSTACCSGQWCGKWLWCCWSLSPSRKSLTDSYVPQDTAAAGALNSTRGFMPRHMVDMPSSAMMRRNTGNCTAWHSMVQDSTQHMSLVNVQPVCVKHG